MDPKDKNHSGSGSTTPFEGEGDGEGSPSPGKLPQARYSIQQDFEQAVKHKTSSKDQSLPITSKLSTKKLTEIEVDAGEQIRSSDNTPSENAKSTKRDPKSRRFNRSASPMSTKSPKSRAKATASAISAKGNESSLAMSPSPLGNSVYPDQNQAKGPANQRTTELTANVAIGSEMVGSALSHSPKIRRPISPKEYLGQNDPQPSHNSY
jgi:hypothetical protein